MSVWHNLSPFENDSWITVPSTTSLVKMYLVTLIMTCTENEIPATIIVHQHTCCSTTPPSNGCPWSGRQQWHLCSNLPGWKEEVCAYNTDSKRSLWSLGLERSWLKPETKDAPWGETGWGDTTVDEKIARKRRSLRHNRRCWSPAAPHYSPKTKAGSHQGPDSVPKVCPRVQSLGPLAVWRSWPMAWGSTLWQVTQL